MVEAMRNSTTKRDRLKKYGSLMGVMVFMLVVHSWQAWMGISALSFFAPTWAKVIFATYAVVNGAVTLTQLHIVCRSTRIVLFAPIKTPVSQLAEFSSRERMSMVMVTLGGQFAFLVSYYLYR